MERHCISELTRAELAAKNAVSRNSESRPIAVSRREDGGTIGREQRCCRLGLVGRKKTPPRARILPNKSDLQGTALSTGPRDDQLDGRGDA